MKKLLILVSITTLVMLLLTGCTAGTNPSIDMLDVEGNTAGFWSGLWHGLISPVTFIISLFSDNVNVYEVYNNGNWYDFGFMLGICLIFGSGAHGSKRKFK